MPLFKRKREFTVKADEVALPEAVRQLAKARVLPMKTKQQMAQTLGHSGLKPEEVRALMSGQKKIKPQELKKLGDVLVQGKIRGLGKYASGASLLKSYIREQEKKQARYYLFRQQREDEAKTPPTASPTLPAGRQGSSSPASPSKNPRIKLPF